MGLFMMMRIHEQGLARGRKPILHVMRHRCFETDRVGCNDFSTRPEVGDSQKVFVLLVMVAGKKQKIG